MCKYVLDRQKCLWITPFTTSMITDEYLNWFNDLDTSKYTSHASYPMTKERALEYIQHSNKPLSSTIVWAIYSNNIHIGNTCLTSIDYHNRSAEFGIIISKTHHKKGIGIKVLDQLLWHGFNKLNMERIWLGTSILNIGMQKVAEKAGMKLEGRYMHGMFHQGKYIDTLVFGIIKYRYGRIKKEGKIDE